MGSHYRYRAPVCLQSTAPVSARGPLHARNKLSCRSPGVRSRALLSHSRPWLQRAPYVQDRAQLYAADAPKQSSARAANAATESHTAASRRDLVARVIKEKAAVSSCQCCSAAA